MIIQKICLQWFVHGVFYKVPFMQCFKDEKNAYEILKNCELGKNDNSSASLLVWQHI